MKKKFIIYIGIFIYAELLFVGVARADEDFSGKWHADVNGTRYTMDITQRDHEIFGNMSLVNGDNRLPILVYGSVNGRRILMNANNREFTITFQFKGAMIGSGSGRGIYGSVTINNRHNYKWHAVTQN